MRRNTILTLSTLVFFMALSALVVSCGGQSGEADADAPPPQSMVSESEEEKSPIEVNGNTVTVNLTGNDLMQYNLKTIEVKEGQKIKLILEHVGKMEKVVMGHNFVLLKEGVDLAAFGAAAATSSATDYIPEAKKEEIIANTRMIGGGESVTIEFDAPAKGTYKFLCSFPGHYAVMQGDFIVS